ncbi:TrkH family potassium uptake protein [Pseudooceanicola sp. 216_PA32_1]|uniref:TrkH family potassium uptake protein n=1 Tax=Pseudooceanicola pacificus TaxID=2676438 RepID=A0A844WEJ5_9RHOB|nr:TrkH family potassium uptake protein [Pseudooceanicola pacificus]MWB77449.1 TrkH family potassium uptake protein [Pseudooceanicola pacificus]
MRVRLQDQPLFLLLAAFASASMFLPALYALSVEDFTSARTFLYSGLLGLFLSGIIALARGPRRRGRKEELNGLLALFAAFLFLPILLALPFYETLRTTTYLNSYFEMVSSLTTTGATIFEDPRRLPNALHLWRAQVGWMGGLLMWIAAGAVMAPLLLGGFEVTSVAYDHMGETRLDQFRRAALLRRVGRISALLVPVYAGLTGALWLFLIIGGDTAFVALCHAMSTMATSGISPVGGIRNSQSGMGGEIVIFLFLFFALSRMTFSSDTSSARQVIWRDPEFRMGAALILIVPGLLFLRHWVAAFEVDSGEDLMLGLRALWGALFTTLSFLSTTGFVSAEWETARMWSGLGTPGMILMGLAMIGGGVATTAGGVKLLRVFALYLASRRELERLVHPHSIGGSGSMSRRMRRRGAHHAWIFFMLFAMTLAAATTLLAALGSGFEAAMLMSIAALTTTGPLIHAAADVPISLAELGPWAKATLCAVMIMGRLELLAIIALFNPDLWRE